MASIEQNHDRHAVPRLRSFAFATKLGELNSGQPPVESPFTAAMLQDVLDDWNSEPGVSVAADLVSTAIVIGQEVLAKTAARFLLTQADAPAAARKMAAICLGEADPTEIAPGVKSIHAEMFAVDRLYNQIHRTRLQLHLYPADPILWTNLSTLYLSLGQSRQAGRAIRVGLSLAPHNRFVLRSAGRILLHIKKGDEALTILRRADCLKSDPWVMAAELAIAAEMKKSSDHMALAQRVVEAEKFPPFDASELAAEIATIRALDGSTWAAKKLLRRAMRQPCENALAQAAWLARIPGMPAMPPEKTVSFEANAWVDRRSGKLRESVLQIRHWLNDQMFSARPAEMGSFVASRLGRFDTSIRFAEHGLRCNPGHAVLLNNLAFACARNGELERAKEALSAVHVPDLPLLDQQVLHATEGLVAYREGDVTRARGLYGQAIKAFREKRDIREAIALTYQAIEELRAGTTEAPQFREAALKLGKDRLSDPEDVIVLKQLEQFGKGEASAEFAVRPAPVPM